MVKESVQCVLRRRGRARGVSDGGRPGVGGRFRQPARVSSGSLRPSASVHYGYVPVCLFVGKVVCRVLQPWGRAGSCRGHPAKTITVFSARDTDSNVLLTSVPARRPRTGSRDSVRGSISIGLSRQPLFSDSDGRLFLGRRFSIFFVGNNVSQKCPALCSNKSRPQSSN